MQYTEALDFVDRVYYGDELAFVYKGVRHLLQGTYIDGYQKLYIFPFDDGGIDWEIKTIGDAFDSAGFQKAPIFDGRTFWEALDDIEWIDFDF